MARSGALSGLGLIRRMLRTQGGRCTTSSFRSALGFRVTPLRGEDAGDSRRVAGSGGFADGPGVGNRCWSVADLINAMERGDFYSSTGVELLDVRRERRTLSVRVKPVPDATFTIQFVGTPKNYDRRSEVILAKDGRPYPTTRRYSPEVGMVFREEHGLSASYTFEGTELYVRAVVISSKKKENGGSSKEVEKAWTQPLVALP